VAKSSDKPAKDEVQTTPAESQTPQPNQQAQRQKIEVDDSKAVACYANFCRVTGTPEELIIDFGLNNQPMGMPTEAIKITERLIVNFYTAKRLLGALHMAVQRHEAAFGALETNVQKRLQPGVLQQQPPPSQ